MSTLSATPLALGGAIGADFPLANSNTTDSGMSAEGFYRLDPYEVRFHFAELELKTYSVAVGVKHFFTNETIRPYVEGAMGPLIVDTPQKGLAYGMHPDVTLGVDLAINRNLSTGVVMRYFALLYFGDTNSGSWEANHGFSLLANFIVWF